MMNEITKPMIAAGLNVEVINTSYLDIKACTGCFGCNNGAFKCVIKDGLEDLKDKISGADMLILVSPCYIFGPPAIMKSILDRSAAWALDKIENGEKKKIGISISFAGAHDEWCSLQKGISSLFLSAYNCEVKVQKLYEQIALKGEVLLQPDILQEGRMIGEKAVGLLQGEEVEIHIEDNDNRFKCDSCKSDVFRIQGKVYTCAICGASFHKTLLGLKSTPSTKKFTPEGAASHSEFIGGKIVSGFAASEEARSRLEKYIADGEIPSSAYKIYHAKEEVSVAWNEEGLAEFQRVVPQAFQKFVKKAVEKKASDQGSALITKEEFLKIKKASGN